ncbi:MAG TPA: bifunctional 4-hydroxy-2-oxoglutarate aldolase/2-dehydro-3-deoxy-phosphogluconate aldolase, partial [Nannocystis sp.]
MSPEQFLDAIFRHRAIAIFRGHHQGRAAAAMDAAVSAGFRLVEFTVTTPGVLELIAEFSRRPGVIVGAGTVLDIAALEAVVGAGAKYLASPVLDPHILSAARDLDVAVLPGCFSPTELLQAHRSGAACQKLFPAPGYLPSYIRAVLAPMPF